MTKEITTTLNSFETLRLKELERMVTEGFLEMAKALSEIRDKRLYRQHYKTYEDYMQERWGKTSRWAEQLIKSATVVQQLPEKMRTMVRNSRTARALADVPESLRPEVVEHISKNDSPVTSATVKEAAKEVASKAKRDFYYVDKTNYPIPEELEALWLRIPEIEDFARRVSALEQEMKEIERCVVEAKDKLWMACDMQRVYTDLRHLAATVRASKPYAVCTQCQGRNTDSCPFCHGQGFINKLAFENQTAEEIKSVREKGSMRQHEKLQAKGLSGRS